MAQQTAVEWLLKELRTEMGYGYDLGKSDTRVLDEIIQQAKQMEKEQIIKAYNQDLYGGLSTYKKFDDGEQYYNEKYGK